MQRINFYFEQYHPKPLSFDSRFAGLIILISALGFLSIGWIESKKLNDLNQRFIDRQEQLSELQNNIVIAQKKLSKKIRKNDIQESLAVAKQDLIRYKKLSSIVNLPIKKMMINYSQILSDLSNKLIQSVWLTQINISENHLNLKGSSTNTESIPEYINQLKKSDSLNRYFDELKIERNQNNSLLVDFQLINGQLINRQIINE